MFIKRFIITLAAITLTTAVQAQRETATIGDDWSFSLGDDITPGALITVNIPHTYNYDALGVNARYRGAANYINNISIPAHFEKKRIFLKFNSVGSDANVYVNGRFAGEHKGAYTAFTIEITDFVKPGGSNSIWLRVNNSHQFDYIPINGGFNHYGGLTGDVQIIATEQACISPLDRGSEGVFIKQTKITDEKASINTIVKLSSKKSGTYSVVVNAITPENNRIAARGESKVKIDKEATADISLSIDNPRLWNGIRDAYMYDFVVCLYDDKIMIDSVKVSSGLRYYKIDAAQGFFLNGKPYKLQGVTYIADRSIRGSALHPNDIEDDTEMMLEMGVNAVRMKNYPHNDYFYSLCDKYGIILWSEIPLVGPEIITDNGYINKPSLKQSASAQLSEMIAQRCNHPSVFFWGLFSNLSTRGDSPVEFIKELNQLAHRADPTRPTVASSNQDGDINFITDLIGWSQYLGWREGAAGDVNLWLGQLTREWPKLKSGIGEYGAGGSILHNENSPPRRPAANESRHPESWQTAYHEQVYPIISQYASLWGSFIHTMFDFGSPTYTGGDTPGICDMGLVTYDRRFKKDAFYFYKAQWNKDEPFVFIAEKRWNKRGRRSQKNIKVFSNQDEVELIVNGASLGRIAGQNGIFRWDNIPLKDGRNTIEAFSGRVGDATEITVNSLNF